jgi:hypothetical protein
MNDQPSSVPPPQQKGLSIASLILGIGSFFFLFLTAIPAIITGHIALNRANKSPAAYGGRGMAIAGLVLGYVGMVLSLVAGIAMLAALMLPALAKAKSKAQTISCVNNMKQIGLAARIWANDHQDKFPPDFITMSNELNTPRILVCPGDSSKAKALDWSQFNENENVTYEFLLPNANESKIANEVAFRCPIHGNTGRGDGSVYQGDARSRWK